MIGLDGVAADDRGLTLGVGLFETLLVVDGSSRLWDAHVARLARGCATLGLPAPAPEALRQAMAAALAVAGLERGRAAVRLTLTGGSAPRGLAAPPRPQPCLIGAAGPAAAPPAVIALATVSVRRNPSSPTARCKTLSYLDNVAARAEASAMGADEALMLDTAGRLACAAAANVFWVRDGVVCTPALACGVLDGVVRGETLRLAPTLGFSTHEVEAPREALRPDQPAFLTNSLIGAVPVGWLDGVALAAPDAALARLLAEVGRAVL